MRWAPEGVTIVDEVGAEDLWELTGAEHEVKREVSSGLHVDIGVGEDVEISGMEPELIMGGRLLATGTFGEGFAEREVDVGEEMEARGPIQSGNDCPEARGAVGGGKIGDTHFERMLIHGVGGGEEACKGA